MNCVSHFFLSSYNTMWDDLWLLLRSSVPIIITSVLGIVNDVVTAALLGRISTIYLASLSLAKIVIMISSTSIFWGGATALDTLCSQSYTALSGDRRTQVGVHLQRALLIFSIFLFLPISVLWLNIERILLAIGQEPEVAHNATTYLRIYLFVLPAYYGSDCLKRFLQGQGIFKASTQVALVVCPLSCVFIYFLVQEYQLVGAAIGVLICYWMIFIGLILYVFFINGKECWGGFSPEAWTQWPSFLRLALPGVIIMCSGVWEYELVSLSSSYFGATVLAAQSIAIQCASTGFMIFVGISIAASNIIGNLLGAGQARHAKRAAFTAILVGLFLSGLNAIILVIFRKKLPFVFSKDPEVATLVERIIPLVALFQCAAGTGIICGGVLNGQGRQPVNAVLRFIGSYLICLPLCFVLGFWFELGLTGFWLALFLGMLCANMAQLYVILHSDWEKEVLRCRERVSTSRPSSQFPVEDEERPLLSE